MSAHSAVSSSSENQTATLLLEWVVTLLGKSLHQNVVVCMLLHVLHYLGHRLGHGHAMDSRFYSQLLHELTLRLQTLLELAHRKRLHNEQRHITMLRLIQLRCRHQISVANLREEKILQQTKMTLRGLPV